MTKEFIEKYDKLAQELGVNNIIRLIPFPADKNTREKELAELKERLIEREKELADIRDENARLKMPELAH